MFRQFYRFVVFFFLCTALSHAQQWRTPSLVKPVNGSVDQSLNPIVSWTSQSGVIYNVQVSDNQQFDTYIISTTYKADAPIAQIMLSDLDYLSTYFVRVRVLMGATETPWSAAVMFTTLEGPLSSPRPVAPLNGAVNQSTRPTLSWRGMSDVAAYDVEVSPTTEFSSVSYYAENIPQTQIVSTLLSPTMTYYWHVRPHNESMQTDWSSTSSFTTGVAPYAPMLALPEHEAFVASTVVNFQWQGIFGAESYHLQVSFSSTFDSCIVDRSNISSNSIMQELPAGSLVFWRVSAVNSIGEGTWSPWRALHIAMSTSDVAALVPEPTVAIAPNPTSSLLNINFTLPASGFVRMSIVDLNGIEVLSATEPQLGVGSYSLPMDVSSIPSGVYTYVVAYNGMRTIGKFVVVR